MLSPLVDWLWRGLTHRNRWCRFRSRWVGFCIRPNEPGQRGVTDSDTESEPDSGTDSGAIAARLHLAPKTVRNQVSALLDRLNVHDRRAAGELARTHGVVPQA
ncbi:MAG: LuxR C-terminal-related transcriptional regulator [Actinomycetes bacterium]